MAFDPFNLLLLAVAVIVFWRLRSVLGSRTGSERPPFDPLGTSPAGKQQTDTNQPGGTVLRFPKDVEDLEVKRGVPEEPKPPVWAGYAEAGSAVAIGLQKIAAADTSFSPKEFIDGAKLAYEMIVDAFAKGDKAALKPLLSREVYDGFCGVIDQREAAGNQVQTRFVGIDATEFVSADLASKRALITMKFASELISATTSATGAIVEGDPQEIRQNTDVWTFERDTSSRDPNWKLIATQEPM
ncbi:MAG: Tim44 domain-containing protein [Alphaproteobacteria bacterium]|nr:Tim44 domain-containing protein [Alphaproteobacteria bacterium]